MKRTLLAVVLIVTASTWWAVHAQRPAAPGAAAPRAQTAASYFPDRFDWQHKRPDEVGMNAALVAEVRAVLRR